MSDEQPLNQCPCCDYFTLEKRNVYEICPICGWVDEFDITIDDLDQKPESNHRTLRDARANFQQIGAYSPNVLNNVLSPKQRGQYKQKPRDIS